MEEKDSGPKQESSGQIRKRPSGKTSKRKKSIRKRRAIGLSLAGGFLLICALVTAIWGVQAWKQAENFLGLADFSTHADSYPFAMHVLNVGKADAILLECEGHFMLVDGGTVDQGVPIRQYLTRRGVQHLDYLVNTHPDDDHMGGLEAVVQQFSVNTFLTTELPDELQPQSASYASLMQTMEQRHVLHKTVVAGDTVSLGSAQVDVLGPVTMADDTNNNSLVLKITYGGNGLSPDGGCGRRGRRKPPKKRDGFVCQCAESWAPRKQYLHNRGTFGGCPARMCGHFCGAGSESFA